MSTEATLIVSVMYFAHLVGSVAVALWARRLGRHAVPWGVLSFFITPYLAAAILLLSAGPRRRAKS